MIVFTEIIRRNERKKAAKSGGLWEVKGNFHSEKFGAIGKKKKKRKSSCQISIRRF